jgi:hypothetical protein
MKRDLSIISGGILAFGAVLWTLWGNPEPHLHAAQALQADPNLKLVSEGSPYMRTER